MKWWADERARTNNVLASTPGIRLVCGSEEVNGCGITSPINAWTLYRICREHHRVLLGLLHLLLLVVTAAIVAKVGC